MGVLNDAHRTDLGGGWTLTQLWDRAGSYYRVDGPNGESQIIETPEYAKRAYKKR